MVLCINVSADDKHPLRRYRNSLVATAGSVICPFSLIIEIPVSCFPDDEARNSTVVFRLSHTGNQGNFINEEPRLLLLNHIRVSATWAEHRYILKQVVIIPLCSQLAPAQSISGCALGCSISQPNPGHTDLGFASYFYV